MFLSYEFENLFDYSIPFVKYYLKKINYYQNFFIYVAK